MIEKCTPYDVVVIGSGGIHLTEYLRSKSPHIH